MISSVRAALSALLLGMGLACSRAEAVRGPAPTTPVTTPDADHGASSIEAGAPASGIDAGVAASSTKSALLLSDSASMAALDAAGYDLGTLIGDEAASNAGALTRGTHYRDLASILEAEVADAKRVDPSSGVGMAFGHRLLDVRLLRDTDARWELVGIAQRFDRDFAAPSHCGELRFLYRLRYDKTVRGLAIASRMPGAAAVSFWNDVGSNDCTAGIEEWARRTTDPKHPTLPSPAELAPRFKSVELNVQTLRWPSTIRGDMAGHAEYALLALVKSKDGARLVRGPLENTPDVARARRDPKYKRALLEWIADPANAARIDEGRAVLPENLSADRATSVTPHGLARRHNRPFRDIFEPNEVTPAADARVARSSEALLRRLDQLSCPGCHASRSVAGFHFLGEETAPSTSVNAVLVGRSAHLAGELVRREGEVARRLAHRGDPAPVPFADRTGAGERGAHCTLGGDPSFASWTCAKGLACARDTGSEGDGIGVCQSRQPTTGDACEVGTMKASSDPHADRIASLTARSCRGACEDNKVGFPDGTCVSLCASLGPEETCAAIPRLVAFNGCLGANRSSFEECILSNATPAAVQSCDETHACRDDYVCARTSKGEGACMPPYFLFQLRVDGHPAPQARNTP